MSAIATDRCTVCRALLDEEDLFCANCGAEAPAREVTAVLAGSAVATHAFHCRGCGASMTYDAAAQTLRCPFCGSEKMDEEPQQRTLAPEVVLPFEVDGSRVKSILHRWLGSSFWRPSDLAERAVVEKLTRVFVPYWIFSAETLTYWTADGSHTPAGARGDWYPLFGDHHRRYDDVLIGASSVLTPQETEALRPFDMSQARPPAEVSTAGIMVEQFKVQRKYARPLARQSIETRESQSCEQYVPGRSRNVKVNVRLEGLQSKPILLPVWVMAYRYKGEVYRFLVNGQSGQHTGAAPFSFWKLALVIGITAACLLGLILLIAASLFS